VTQTSLRQNIGVVAQDTILFNDTIFNNIAYGKSGAEKNEIITAAKLAHIHDFIETLPKGYQTEVGER
jgi:ATP-binding cassette subfamily B protein